MIFHKSPFKHAFAHKGGGQAAAQNVTNTIQSTPPPPTAQSVEIQMEKRDAAKQAAKRKGINKTILAGETGAAAPGTILGAGESGTTQRRTSLLGGG